jgi:hypothetical protein
MIKMGDIKKAVFTMSMLMCLTCTIIFLFTTLVKSGSAEETIVRQYPGADYGDIQFNVPISWKEEVLKPDKSSSPTILFTNKQGAGFEVLITPKSIIEKNILQPDIMRRRVQSAADSAKSRAVEKVLKLTEIKGNSGLGYSFTATDREPKPGGYKIMTQGMIQAGEKVLAFTILTNTGQQNIIDSAIVMLKTAKLIPNLAPTSRTTLKIPDTGWAISFDSPRLSKPEESRVGPNYAFRATSGRFNISVFVEQQEGTGDMHSDCYRYYWPMASKNPKILQDTVSVSRTGRYYRVQYDLGAEFKGRFIKQKNVNYYFAYQGKWVDVHISIASPTKEDEPIFTLFDKSLTYADL